MPTYSPCSVAEHSVALAMALNRCRGNVCVCPGFSRLQAPVAESCSLAAGLPRPSHRLSFTAMDTAQTRAALSVTQLMMYA